MIGSVPDTKKMPTVMCLQKTNRLLNHFLEMHSREAEPEAQTPVCSCSTDPVPPLPQIMDLPVVMALPLLIVVAAGVYYIYTEVMQFMSKSPVRNKVVVITDAVSGMGAGKWCHFNIPP